MRKQTIYIHPDYWPIRAKILAILRKEPFVRVRAKIHANKDRKEFSLIFLKEADSYTLRAILQLGMWMQQNGYTKHFTDPITSEVYPQCINSGKCKEICSICYNN